MLDDEVEDNYQAVSKDNRKNVIVRRASACTARLASRGYIPER